MNINIALGKFSDFLNKSWAVVTPLLFDRAYTSNEGAIGDWLQANWELLVERKVLAIRDYLEIYGAGAEYNGASSRITDLDSIPNFNIVIINDHKNVIDLLTNESVNPSNLIFDELVGFENGYYVTQPPFNYVLVHDIVINVERVFPIKSIVFELRKH